MWQSLCRCAISDPAQQRNGALLAEVLLLLAGINALCVGRELVYPADSVFVRLVLLGSLILLGALYLANRRGAVGPATWGLLALLMLAVNGLSTAGPAFIPDLVDPLFFVLPIALAGALLPLRALLLIVGGAILNAAWLYMAGSPGLAALRAAPDQLREQVVNAGVLFVATGVFAWLSYRRLNQALAEQQRLYGALQVKEAQRAHLLAQVLAAQEEERRRLTRELHDGPVQALLAQKLVLERCGEQLAAGATATLQKDLDCLWRRECEIIATLRDLMSHLRPPGLDSFGLGSALQQFATEFSRDSTLAVVVEAQLAAQLNPDQEILVFRVIQEALINARTHSQATQARVRLTHRAGRLYGEIRDNGCGFVLTEAASRALATGHLGLASMRERAEAAGGHLTITSMPGTGTRIAFVIPARTPSAPLVPASADLEPASAVLLPPDTYATSPYPSGNQTNIRRI
jgi:signal transduction histidine kinase